MSRTVPFADLDPADRRLLEVARDVSVHAYAPYSGFAVGAAVRTRAGAVYSGANLENASYGLGICAEVSVIAVANAAGDFDLEALAVVGHKFVPPQDGTQIVTPCGRCRQVIFEAAETSGVDIRVFSCNGDLTEVVESRISELLPSPFGPAQLGLTQVWPGMRAQLKDAVARLKNVQPDDAGRHLTGTKQTAAGRKQVAAPGVHSSAEMDLKVEDRDRSR